MTAFEPLHRVCFRLGNRVCPLYRIGDDGHAFLVGTGIPIAFRNEYVVATAAHVMRDSHAGRLVTMNAVETIMIGGHTAVYEHLPGQTIDVDVAAIRLSPEEAREVGAEFTFTYLEDAGDVLAYDKLTVYAMVGYPHSKNRPNRTGQSRIRATPTYIVLREFVAIEKLRSSGKNDAIHFAFAAPLKKSTDISGSRITLPKLQGMSGGGVWRV